MSMYSLLLCCWKRVFVMTSAFSWQNSISFCPASFHIPRPNLSVTPGVSWLPTFAFQSPIMKRTSFWVLVLAGLVGLHRTIQLQLLQQYWSGHRLGLLWYWSFHLKLLGYIPTWRHGDKPWPPPSNWQWNPEQIKSNGNGLRAFESVLSDTKECEGWTHTTMWMDFRTITEWESHGMRSLVGYNPWGSKESDTTERLYFLFLSFYFVREASLKIVSAVGHHLWEGQEQAKLIKDEIKMRTMAASGGSVGVGGVGRGLRAPSGW